jgi:steroid delta-isomerase-like uncharacterized protein
MSIKENKALIRLYYELWNRRDVTPILELLAPGYVLHLTDTDIFLKQEKQVDTDYLTAFPDVITTVDDIVAEGDKVAVRATWKGTHKKDFMGIPATGKRFDITNTSIFRIAAGKIAEIWSTQDSLRFLQQLGVIPKPQT